MPRRLEDFTTANSEQRQTFDERLQQSSAPVAEVHKNLDRPDDILQLHEISTALIQERNLDLLYNRILDVAMGLMSSDMASMQLFDAERSQLRLLAWKGFHPQSAIFWEWVNFMTGTADLEEFRRSNIRAVQSTPLVSRSGQLLGMIATHWREPHQPTERALQQLDVLARQAADLIERSRAEAALRESNDQLRWLASIIESSDDAIISENLDGVITSWNKGAERVFGYTAEEAVGKPITFLIPSDRQDEEPAILERVKSGERVERYETVRQRKDGSLIVISLTVSPVRNAEGTIVGASKIARNISMSELTQLNRVATAGELSATIAHEIRQPITGMVTNANAALRWLSRETPDIGNARDALGKIVKAGHYAGDVITGIRAMFGKDTEKKAPTDVNKLIRTVLALVYMDLRKHSIECQLDLSEQLPPVMGNEVQLEQVILNLVMNAIESMKSTEPRVLSIKSETHGHDGMRVAIEDTGSGIDPSNRNRIFKPLFTTKSRGMGMGLAICRSIIESHDGRIWMSGGASRGSVFQFELPTGGIKH
jgi:PAS domain S-box-containing protein